MWFEFTISVYNLQQTDTLSVSEAMRDKNRPQNLLRPAAAVVVIAMVSVVPIGIYKKNRGKNPQFIQKFTF